MCRRKPWPTRIKSFWPSNIRKLLSLLLLILPALAVASAETPKFVYQSPVASRGESLDGYDGVNLEILDEDGNLYFFSPELDRKPFIQREDTLADVLAALNKQGWNKEGHLTMLDLSPLSDKRFRLSPRRIGSVIEGLSGHYVFTDVLCEPLSSESLSFVYLAAVQSGKKLNMKITSPGFENYVLDYAGTDPKLARSPHRWIVHDTTGTLAAGDIAFSLAADLKIPVWASSPVRNLVLYREVRDIPEGFILDSEAPGLREDIIELRKLEAAKEKKPVANLVLAPSKPPKFTFPEMFGGIMNALSANGYEVRVTFEQFLDKADLYYIVGREDWLDNLPFFNKVLHILDHKRSMFYGPVILHPTGEIKNRSHWEEIRKLFKIPATETGWINEIPAFVKEKGRNTAWGGNPIPKGAGMTFIRAKQVQDFGGDVLLSGLSGTQTVAMILRDGNHYLVNGAPLPMEADYIISKLAGGAFEAPAGAAVTTGRQRCAAYAFEDTRLGLRFPAPEPPSQWRKIVYDKDGKRVQDILIPGSKVLEADLRAGELLVLQAVSP